LGWCWWGVVGLNFASEGTVLMFCVALDLGSIAYEGFHLLSLSFSELPSRVTNLNVVGFFTTVGWAASCHAKAQRFWVGESGPA